MRELDLKQMMHGLSISSPSFTAGTLLIWHRCREMLVRCVLYKTISRRYLCRRASCVRCNNIENDRKTGFIQFLKFMYTYKKQKHIRNEMNVQ